MSDKNKNIEKDSGMTLEEYKEMTKLDIIDILLIIGTTFFLIFLYASLYFKIEFTCRYLLPYGYLIVVAILIVAFVVQIKEMNKKF